MQNTITTGNLFSLFIPPINRKRATTIATTESVSRSYWQYPHPFSRLSCNALKQHNNNIGNNKNTLRGNKKKKKWIFVTEFSRKESERRYL